METSFSPTLLEDLRQQSTCLVASAIESFGVRMPNTGFTDSTVRCMFPDLPAVIGYAVTAKVKSAAPPMGGKTYYYWRSDWWKQVLALPAPRIMVLEDEDHPPGLGAFVGEVHSHILHGLGCTALVTNGAVRDLPQVHGCGLQLFAGNVSVSHAYAHISSFGETVQVGHLKIRPGDLLLGDMHGIVSIPAEIAAQVPAAARGIRERRQRIIGVCRPGSFTMEHLESAQKDIQAMELEEARPRSAGNQRGEL